MSRNVGSIILASDASPAPSEFEIPDGVSISAERVGGVALMMGVDGTVVWKRSRIMYTREESVDG